MLCVGLSLVAELLGFVLVSLVGVGPVNIGHVDTIHLGPRLVPHAPEVVCDSQNVVLFLVVCSGLLPVVLPHIPIWLGKLVAKSVLQIFPSPRLNLGERLVDPSTRCLGSGLGLILPC